MKRFSFIMAALLLLTGFSFAQQRSAEEAAAIAASFVNERPALRKAHGADQNAAAMRLAHTRQKQASEENAFYVFNRADNAGFIIVSADERTAEDVLGYSDEGDFNLETANPNFRWWLDRYAEEISSLNGEVEVNPAPRKAVQVTAIGPLLKNQSGVEIKWYQEEPYYNYCPIDQRDNTRCLTGCVATATAQIMYKWRWPEKGKGSHSYKWYDCKDDDCSDYWTKTLKSNFDTVTLYWDRMLPKYGGKSYTTEQANAVASLMYNVGVSCDMWYGGNETGGSGAFTDDMAYALKTYWGYKFTKFITMYTSKSNYENNCKGSKLADVTAEFNVSRDQFVEYFNAELEAGRPILMGGEGNAGGHEFVCDGRNTSGKFHINWGWEGDSNGYFKLSSLSAGGSSFSSNLDALIGLEPDKPEAVENVSVEHKATKTIYNGQVVIIRDGVRYNLFGQIVE